MSFLYEPIPAKNMYLIVQKVWTSAEVYSLFELENFYLLPNHPDSKSERKSWLAVRGMEASSWREAYSQTSQDLIRLIDSLHVVLQCVFSLGGASWFVWRLYDGPPGIVVANLVRPQSVVSMGLWDDKAVRDVKRLRSANESALLYFRESGRASTAKTKISMLVIAAEALAGSIGKSSKCNRCTASLLCPNCRIENNYAATNMDRVKTILGAEIFKALYRNPENLRNKLMHGNLIDERRANELANLAYNRIRLFLQSEFGLESDPDVTNAPRPLEGFSLSAVCLRPPASWLPTPIDLRNVDWPKCFSDLENADLLNFGEHVSEPPGL